MMNIDDILALDPRDRATLFRAARSWLDLQSHDLPRSPWTQASLARDTNPVSEKTVRAVWAVFFDLGLQFRLDDDGTMWIGKKRP
jgi:hypothetical protein